MKKLLFGVLAFFIGFGVFAQTRIPAWNLQGWGGNPVRNSDVSYFLAWRERNFSSLVNYTLRLDNVPMGNISKPAIFIKVDNSDYSIWSNYAEMELHQWNYYEINNYVILALEMSFRVPDRYSIAGANAGERIYFRYYLDPQDINTERLVNNWANLEGPIYVFFLGNSIGNMNYYYVDMPDAVKSVGQTVLSDARAALSNIQNKGTFQAALSALSGNYPNRETYVFPNIQRFQGKYSLYVEAISTW